MSSVSIRIRSASRNRCRECTKPRAETANRSTLQLPLPSSRDRTTLGALPTEGWPTMNSRRREGIIDEVEAARWIESGMTIAIGMPTPYALVRQIIRRGLRDLTVVDSGFSLDLLIGAGCVRKVVSYYAGGGFGNPVTPMFRRAAERGEIEVWECEEGILCAGLQAAAQMLPFVPWRGGVGTSLPEVNPDLKLFKDPIRGETLIAVPPIKPDVTILHAATADAYGNVQHIGGPGWIDMFLCRPADPVIVQVHQVVSHEDIPPPPSQPPTPPPHPLLP